MTKIIASATMSLDGFIAHADHTIDPLFEWYENGDVEVPSAAPDVQFRLSPQSAAYFSASTARMGVLLVGRTLFDITDGWRGRHPLDVPVVVLTHEPPTGWSYPGSENFHFVTEGIEAAVSKAREIAGSKDVGVAAGTIARQCLEAGLLDEVAVDLVPVVLGTGRPYFGELSGGAPIRLGDPVTTIQGDRVTHLVFEVTR